MNLLEAKQLAAWDQVESEWAKQTSALSDNDLRLLLDHIKDMNLTKEQMTNLIPTAFVGYAFALIYEVQRRAGGFGSDGYNPCGDQTP